MHPQVLSTSTNAVAREIVALAEAREKAAAEGARPGAKSAAFASVSKRFVDDINTLVGALDQTTTHLPTHLPTYPLTHPTHSAGALNQTTAHFVRCMKPNPRFAALDFDHDVIMAQLKCNGTLEAVQLMRHGYPNRVPYDLMFDRYQKHLSGVRAIVCIPCVPQ